MSSPSIVTDGLSGTVSVPSISVVTGNWIGFPSNSVTPYPKVAGLSGDYLDAVATLGDRVVLILKVRQIVEYAPAAA